MLCHYFVGILLQKNRVRGLSEISYVLVEGIQHRVKNLFHFGDMGAVPVYFSATGAFFEAVVVFFGKRFQKMNNALFINDNQRTVADQTAAERNNEVFRSEPGKYLLQLQAVVNRTYELAVIDSSAFEQVMAAADENAAGRRSLAADIDRRSLGGIFGIETGHAHVAGKPGDRRIAHESYTIQWFRMKNGGCSQGSLFGKGMKMDFFAVFADMAKTHLSCLYVDTADFGMRYALRFDNVLDRRSPVEDVVNRPGAVVRRQKVDKIAMQYEKDAARCHKKLFSGWDSRRLCFVVPASR